MGSLGGEYHLEFYLTGLKRIFRNGPKSQNIRYIKHEKQRNLVAKIKF